MAFSCYWNIYDYNLQQDIKLSNGRTSYNLGKIQIIFQLKYNIYLHSVAYILLLSFTINWNASNAGIN